MKRIRALTQPHTSLLHWHYGLNDRLRCPTLHIRTKIYQQFLCVILASVMGRKAEHRRHERLFRPIAHMRADRRLTIGTCNLVI